MPNTDAERLAALLAEHDAIGYDDCDGCLCGADVRTHDQYRAHVAAVLTAAGVGFVAEAERERDEARATNDRLNRRVQIAEAAVHELTTGTGNGKARPVAAEMWARCQETHERHCPRAERAEAALTDLRSRVRALADEYAAAAEAHRLTSTRAEVQFCTLVTGDLRALLDTEADQ